MAPCIRSDPTSQQCQSIRARNATAGFALGPPGRTDQIFREAIREGEFVTYDKLFEESEPCERSMSSSTTVVAFHFLPSWLISLDLFA